MPGTGSAFALGRNWLLLVQMLFPRCGGARGISTRDRFHIASKCKQISTGPGTGTVSNKVLCTVSGRMFIESFANLLALWRCALSSQCSLNEMTAFAKEHLQNGLEAMFYVESFTNDFLELQIWVTGNNKKIIFYILACQHCCIPSQSHYHWPLFDTSLPSLLTRVARKRYTCFGSG